jgi:diadenosine tetraphosphate (Ap4A) HIT family hydrolase
MLIRKVTSEDIKREKPYKKNWKKVKEHNLCPTCEQAKHKNVFIEDNTELIYEDDLFLVKFEHNPRREGHSIVIIKPHYEDISEMPIELAHKFMAISKALIDSLKTNLKPIKVYMVTMCDGGRNHLHFQYIPRYEGESHGKHVFVDERKRFHYNEKQVEKIKTLFLKGLKKYNY